LILATAREFGSAREKRPIQFHVGASPFDSGAVPNLLIENKAKSIT
jgi:hypothetical protein